MKTIKGFLDGLRDGELIGWACDTEHPNSPVEVNVYLGEERIATGRADIAREDLKHEAPGGRCAFSIPIGLRNIEKIHVRVSGAVLPRSSDFAVANRKTSGRSRFETRAPSHQNAIDIFADGWASDLNPIFPGAISGQAAHFQPDQRTIDAVRLFGKDGRLDGMRILELGPLEGGHTYTLENLGGSVLAIESNADAFLKCLVAKEIAGGRHARFMLGDFVEYMLATPDRFDMVFASGVLYHMQDPIRAIEAIARVTDHCFVWTHVFDDRTYNGPPRRSITNDRFSAIPLFELEYGASIDERRFWGGNQPRAAWMRRDDMLNVFRHYGLATINTIEVPAANGHAALCFAASRSI